ncbi:MAG TPA: hypothetical protein DCL16_09155 [Acidimicrobiaceae bacterium]|nr:hypothetical protein [Acidimicrobiaceae bacterium]
MKVAMNRSEHIAGLEVERLTPPDIEYFFRTLHSRVPKSTGESTQPVLDQLRLRLRNLALALGEITAKQTATTDVQDVLDAISYRLERMKRREWRTRIDGLSVLKRLRSEVGEISADLHEIATG